VRRAGNFREKTRHLLQGKAYFFHMGDTLHNVSLFLILTHCTYESFSLHSLLVQ